MKDVQFLMHFNKLLFYKSEEVACFFLIKNLVVGFSLPYGLVVDRMTQQDRYVQYVIIFHINS